VVCSDWLEDDEDDEVTVVPLPDDVLADPTVTAVVGDVVAAAVAWVAAARPHPITPTAPAPLTAAAVVMRRRRRSALSRRAAASRLGWDCMGRDLGVVVKE